jgi:hypothetical protein
MFCPSHTVVDLQFNDKKESCVSVLCGKFLFVIFLGASKICVVVFDSFAHFLEFCMTGKSAIEISQSSVGP